MALRDGESELLLFYFFPFYNYCSIFIPFLFVFRFLFSDTFFRCRAGKSNKFNHERLIKRLIERRKNKEQRLLIKLSSGKRFVETA